ncbi:hypothetical protein Tco_0575845 [Tanacetum coccineum]
MRILSVVSVSVDKRLWYGYLKEIMVRRADKKLYTFKEGDFPRLHLNDIEDMLLLCVQNKLFNLEGDDLIDLVTALRLFTRSIVMKAAWSKLQVRLQRKNAKEKMDREGSVLDKHNGKEDWRRAAENKDNKELEVLVGGRNTETDRRLLQRTV